MALATARLLVGRKIVAFELGSFDDKKGGTAHDPIIILDNGAALKFVTEETEMGEYGVTPLYIPRRRKKSKP